MNQNATGIDLSNLKKIEEEKKKINLTVINDNNAYKIK